MIRRRCASLTTIIWSRHSLRVDPIKRSTYPFCHGDRGWSRISLASNSCLSTSTRDCPPPGKTTAASPCSKESRKAVSTSATLFRIRRPDQPRPRSHPSAQDYQLLAKRNIFHFKPRIRFRRPRLYCTQGIQEIQDIDHSARACPDSLNLAPG